MSRVGSIHEWYRFLDAHSDDEAVSELRRHLSRLEDAHQAVDQAYRRIAFSPGGEVDELVSIARLSLAEASEMLHGVIQRFRAGFASDTAIRSVAASHPAPSATTLEPGDVT